MNDSDSSPVALVTGGAKRVGRVVCQTLAANGYRLAIHANTSLDDAQTLAKELSDAGSEAAAFGADLRDEGARSMVDRAHRRFGRLDLLVNSAAIWQPLAFDLVAADDVRKYFDINCVATFVCAQHAGLIMAEQEAGGAIINFGDIAMHHPQPEYAAYHPSKGAIPTMTRSLAVELAQRNPRVRVDAILPGPVLVSDDESADRKREVQQGTLLDAMGHAEHLRTRFCS